jgi:hypothetical protein
VRKKLEMVFDQPPGHVTVKPLPDAAHMPAIGAPQGSPMQAHEGAIPAHAIGNGAQEYESGVLGTSE